MTFTAVVHYQGEQVTKQAAKMTARGLKAGAGAVMLTLAAGMPAGADDTTTTSVDQTINVPGQTPSGFVSVDDEKHEIPGVKDITVNIKATGALADPVTLGKSGGLACDQLDKSIQLELAAGATGTVTVSYTQVDGDTGDETAVSPSPIPFGGGVSGASPVIKLCVR